LAEVIGRRAASEALDGGAEAAEAAGREAGAAGDAISHSIENTVRAIRKSIVRRKRGKASQ
ncbi:MAG: hypothetical protein KGM47_10115, partial [Acidobacteriota bacterium]|nr:hypothetical protein [Acidobacteriota bacterium]